MAPALIYGIPAAATALGLAPLIQEYGQPAVESVVGNIEDFISRFGQDVKTRGGRTYIGPDADDIERFREEEARRLRGFPAPPPKVDEGIILKGPDPDDLDILNIPPGDPIPPQEKPEPVGGGFGAGLPPKTLDDYIMTMASKGDGFKNLVDNIESGKKEKGEVSLANVKKRSKTFLDTYDEPLSESSIAQGRAERTAVKSFIDLVPDGEAEMKALKSDFVGLYNNIASSEDPIQAYKDLREATGDLYTYLLNETSNQRISDGYTKFAATLATDTRLENPDDPYAQKFLKQELIKKYFIDKAAQYAADENVPKLLNEEGELVPALNDYNFYKAENAIADLKALYSNHPNKKIAEFFSGLVEGDFASAQKIRKTFTEPKETGSLQRIQTYSEDVRQAVRDNVEYIDSTLKPEQKFRSDIMSIPKVKAAISMTARRLDLDEAFVRKQTENFLSEFFRSRDEGARTGQGIQDAQIVVRLLEDSGLFNPLSDNFLARNKEYIAYLKKREKQLEGQDLSHKGEVQNPNISGYAPYSGAEESMVDFLPEQVNREVQRAIERDMKTALAENDKVTEERLQKEADALGIETKIKHPKTGEDYPIGLRDLNYEFEIDPFILEYGDDLKKFRDGGIASMKYTTRPLGF